MQQLNSNLPGNQRGATLIVALIILLLLALLGASSLKNAANAERMSAAGYQKYITFHASENAATIAYGPGGEVVGNAIAANGSTGEIEIDTGSDTTVTFVEALPLGSGATLNSSLGGVAGHRVKVTSTARLKDNEKSQTVTEHGVLRLGPSL